MLPSSVIDAGVDYITENTKRDLDTNCWNWQNFKAKGDYDYGYGRLAGVKDRLVHRIAYQIFVGELSPGDRLHQKCSNRRCCNPAHLVLCFRPKSRYKPPTDGRYLAPTGPAENAATAVETCYKTSITTTAVSEFNSESDWNTAFRKLFLENPILKK
jgi:hypothetical protein